MAAKPKDKEKNNLPATVEKIDATTGEVTKTEAAASPPATVDDEFAAASVGANVSIAKQVTVPVLPWPAGAEIVFSPLEPIKMGKELKGTRGGKANYGPAQIMLVRGMKKGVLRQLIVGAVLEAELKESYPDDSYVNRWFLAKKIAPNEDKEQRYATYQVMEINKPAHFE